MSLQFVFVLSDSANDRKGDTGLCGCATRFMVSPRGCILSVSSSKKSPSRAGGVCPPGSTNYLPLSSGEEHVQGSSPVPVPVPKKGCRKRSPQQGLSSMAQKQTGDLLHMQRLPVHHGGMREASRSVPSIQKPRQCLGKDGRDRGEM